MKTNSIEILYIGIHYPQEREKELLRICKGNVSAAHFTFQENIIKAISKFCNIDILVSLPLGSFPIMCKKLFAKTNNKYQYKEIGFINFPIVKDILREKKAKYEMQKWISKQNINDHKFIIIYDACIPFINAAIKVRQKNKKCRVICIVPDLPGELGIENGKYNTIVSKYLKIKSRCFYKISKKIDGFIVLTKHMIQAMDVKEYPYLQLECIVNIDNRITEIENKENKIFMYAGELSTNVNIDIMIKAFEQINLENIQLWICGTGKMKGYVERAARANSKIKYLGFIPKKELYTIQQNVYAFINPRQNNFEYTKYSFPSKNAEYLKTGKPLISYKLYGIPDEYDDFIFYPKDNSIAELKNTIIKVYDIQENQLFELKDRQIKFMNKHKSIDAQGERIYTFLRGLCDG